MQLQFFSDPGHGWLQVPRALVKQVGIEKEISQYSYQKGVNVFLEEDCDAPKFMKAAEVHGLNFDIVENTTNTDSVIRSWPQYKAL